MDKKQMNCVAPVPYLALALFLMLMVSPLSADRPVAAIKGGDLYTITSGIIRNGTILIKDGKISRIGQNIEVPKNARVIDARGKVVMPGLVAATAEVGVSGSANINKIADSLDPFDYNVSLTTYGDLDNMLLREPVAENVSLSRSLWMRKTNFLQNLRKARDYLQKLDADKGAPDKAKRPQEIKKPSGVDAYIRLLRRQLPARLSGTTAADILGTLELVDEFGIRIIIEDAIEGWIVAEEIAKRNVSVIITPRQKRRPNEDISGPSGSTLENAAILKKAGVKFAVVPPDASFTTWGVAGRDLMALPMEAAFAVSGGLDEQTALEAITITAAEIIGVADRVGSLQVGKDADIIILDGHPFHHKTFVELTLINGKILYDKKKSIYFSHITPDD
ncbi:MAG: hypothetical protein AMJ75_12410 [Phycisphaerae bacterium SM1_79]|nr:MAG: hypothetical protein AMJ75_12410 [Phycisphaerae bacterium SM1_79]